jgi:hypothetical protein
MSYVFGFGDEGIPSTQVKSLAVRNTQVEKKEEDLRPELEQITDAGDEDLGTSLRDEINKVRVSVKITPLVPPDEYIPPPPPEKENFAIGGIALLVILFLLLSKS